MACPMRRLAYSLLLLVVGFLSLSAQANKPASPAGIAEVKPDPAAGRRIYKAHCALCHFADANIDKVGPGMKGLFTWKKLPLSGLSLTEKNVRRRIEDGTPNPEKPLMPAYKDILTAKEMYDLVAYLKTL